MCEADIRNKRALFLIENEWGCGRIDVGRIKEILRGDGCECEDSHACAR
jgi:hypothetical protein